jgi:hypothetical protein
METNAEEANEEEEVVVEVVGKGTAQLGTPSTLETAGYAESSSEDSDSDSIQLVQELSPDKKKTCIEELG